MSCVGFTMLPSYYEALRPLPDDQRLQMYDAIMDYAFSGKDPERLSPILAGYFHLMRPNIDNSIKHYSASVTNGKKGGRPPKKPSENLTETQQKPSGNREKEKDMDISSCPASSNAEPDPPKKKIQRLYEPNENPYRAALYLAAHISENFPGSKPTSETQLQSWADSFRLLHERDGYSWDVISEVLAWSQDDDFWKRNILSGGTFRKQFLKLLAKSGARQ